MTEKQRLKKLARLEVGSWNLFHFSPKEMISKMRDKVRNGLYPKVMIAMTKEEITRRIARRQIRNYKYKAKAK